MTFHHTDTNHPLENEYPKLVRDRIPQIIKENDGIEVPVQVLDDNAFLAQLLRKAAEEAQELSKATSDENIQEEIADIYEIIDALIELRGFSKEEILALQDKKRIKRGGFTQRLLMLHNGEK